MLSTFFKLVFYKPFLNMLVWLVGILPGNSVGLAVILLTVAVRFIIFPFTHSATKTQIKIKEIEPELRKIKTDFKSDSRGQAQKTMELYKKHGINPFSGILTLFIQIPVVIALYRVFLGGVNFVSADLYSFVSLPTSIGINFLWFIDMTQRSIILAVLSGLSHFIQMQVMMPENKEEKKKDDSIGGQLARNMNFQFKYIMPLFIFIIALNLSAAISLYWTTTNVFAIVHAINVKKKADKIKGI